MVRHIRSALMTLLLLTLTTGVLYPLVVTGIGQALFPSRVNGSIIRRNGRAVGSALIGQAFSSPRYFWSRPSATRPFPYNAASSSGSNYGPLNPALLKAVKERVDLLRAADPQNGGPIPADLVTASASGLDPHISIAAAMYQVGRVARARYMPEAKVRALVSRYTDRPFLGVIGEPTVNVLRLNLALDESSGGSG
jgi:K+-transporting ATPase ATPase C chain